MKKVNRNTAYNFKLEYNILFLYLGRISNRFSKDIGAIDDILPKILLSYLQVIIFKNS